MNILKKLFAPRVEYNPLIEVRVFKDAILHNLNQFQKTYPKIKFAPVLKSNAYGHGLIQVANILDSQNLPFFMVDSFFEALQLKREGIRTKILILGYNRLEQIANNKLKNVSFGVIDFEQLKQITHNLNKPQTFHLKIDTGMHRQGILLEQVTDAIKLIKQNKNFVLEGICTHFAEADGESKEFTEKQIVAWNAVSKNFRSEFSSIAYIHASNTAGSFYTPSLDVNIGRVGIGLFGINQSPFGKLNLKPSLEMISIISSIKHIQAGEKVGYGITFTASQNMVVATVPVGYNEGVDRRLSNTGSFKINAIDCPIVGRVSMNMCSVDVTEISSQLKLEQEVVVISKNPTDQNSVENIAKVCQTIPYEILVHIHAFLKRTVI